MISDKSTSFQSKSSKSDQALSKDVLIFMALLLSSMWASQFISGRPLPAFTLITAAVGMLTGFIGYCFRKALTMLFLEDDGQKDNNND